MALNVKLAKALAEPGRYGDGHGLYLNVGNGNGKSWLLRYERAGRERWMGLGSFHEFDLEEARERARKARQLLRDGIDPLETKRAARATRVLEDSKHRTFKEVAQQYFDGHQHKWTNAEHRRQFLSTLEEYAFPKLGKMPVAVIDTPLILDVLRPIWKSKHVTAGRVRSRIEAVLGFATVSGFRTGDNPARWKGHLKEVLSGSGKVKHHAAMPFAEVPGFIAALQKHQGIDAKALEFLILTAARSGEVFHTRRSEIDFEQKMWTVPADRIKGRIEHRVPLVDRAVEILKALPAESDYVFPGARKGRPLSKMAMAKVVAAMGHDVTVHGFRSSFRDFVGESTAFAADIAEVALAHAVGGKTQIAYQRGDLLAKRRKLMEAWAAFCSSPSRDATIVPIRKRKDA